MLNEEGFTKIVESRPMIKNESEIQPFEMENNINHRAQLNSQKQEKKTK